MCPSWSSTELAAETSVCACGAGVLLLMDGEWSHPIWSSTELTAGTFEAGIGVLVVCWYGIRFGDGGVELVRARSSGR